MSISPAAASSSPAIPSASSPSTTGSARPTPIPSAIEIVFASEPAAILAHPSVECRPDLVTLSSYLTTIRTTLGDRTLYQGIRVVRPGEILEFDLSDGPSAGQVTRSFIPPEDRLPLDDATIESAAVLTGNSVRDSVHRHLRSDVPTCVLLLGWA